MRRGKDDIRDTGEREIRYNGPEDGQRGLEALPSISKVRTLVFFTICI